MTSHHEFHATRLRAQLTEPTGGVSKDLIKRGYRVAARAKLLLSGAEGYVRRVDTGELRSSIFVRLVYVRQLPTVRVGSSLERARWVHDGTGIYGPRRRRITPVTKKALSWRNRTGLRVTVRSTAGMKPNAFLKDALPAASLKV